MWEVTQVKCEISCSENVLGEMCKVATVSVVSTTEKRLRIGVRGPDVECDVCGSGDVIG